MPRSEDTTTLEWRPDTQSKIVDLALPFIHITNKGWKFKDEFTHPYSYEDRYEWTFPSPSDHRIIIATGALDEFFGRLNEMVNRLRPHLASKLVERNVA